MADLKAARGAGAKRAAPGPLLPPDDPTAVVLEPEAAPALPPAGLTLPKRRRVAAVALEGDSDDEDSDGEGPADLLDWRAKCSAF